MPDIISQSLPDDAEMLVVEILGEDESLQNIEDTAPSYDRRRTDYKWWSRFRFAKASGYEFASAAFGEPLLNVLAQHILGDGFTVKTGDDTADEIFAEFQRVHQNTLHMWLKDALAVGDSYIVVNPDGSMSMPPAHTARVLHDPFDYTLTTGYEFHTVIDRGFITDRYLSDVRIVTVDISDDDEPVDETMQPESGNPVPESIPSGRRQRIYSAIVPGELPVAHISWNRGGNEVYGRPCYAPLLTVFRAYHRLLDSTVKGVRIMGRPIPFVGGAKDPMVARDQNSRKVTYTDKDGITREKYVVNFEQLNMLWLGEGARFEFATPGPFADESQKILKLLFLIAIEHLRVPEYVWGAAITGSKASAETQQPPFTRSIDAARIALEPVMLHLLSIWYQVVGLVEPHPAIELDEMNIVWPEVAPSDDMTQLEKLKFAVMNSLITPETALIQLDLGIDDPAAEVEAAQEFSDEQADKELERIESMVPNDSAAPPNRSSSGSSNSSS